MLTLLKKSQQFLALFLSACALMSFSGNLKGQTAEISPIKIIAPTVHSGKIALTAKIVANPFSEKNSASLTGKALVFKPGETLEILIEGTPAKGFHTYPINYRTAIQDEAMLSTLRFSPEGQLFAIWPLLESPAKKVREEAFGGEILEFDGPFAWHLQVLIDPKYKGDVAYQKINARIQVCDDKGCNWGDHIIELNLPLLPSQSISKEPNLPQNHTPPPSPSIIGEKSPSPTLTNLGFPKKDTTLRQVNRVPELPAKGQFFELARYSEGTIHDVDAFKEFLLQKTSSQVSDQSSSLLEFILVGIFWGGISLVTPCVFPMIPVTVSIFLKQKDGDKHSPVNKALIYCGTITVVLTLAAVLALSLFVWLSINWIFNTFMGFLFIFFALSLFGMYDIELPSWLTTWSSQNEQKGGATGIIFMALTFSMLSFACVAPFLGGFGANSAGRPFFHQLLGGLAFSATFAAPFFFLALFPGLLRNLPRSGTWLNTIKVAMGFVELMAAIKFFRLAEIREGTAIWFTYDFSLALTVAILIAGSLYLFQFFRLPLDTELEHLGVPRMVFAIAFLCLAIHLFPGLFHSPGEAARNRPQGIVYAWIDSFLLPDNEPNSHSETDRFKLNWGGDLALALESSRKDGRPVFIDFTGVTCTNCKLNEKQVFSRPDVETLFQAFHLVQLYTDRVIPEFIPEMELQKDKNLMAKLAEDNANFRNENFKVEQLPFYVIVSPSLKTE